MGTAPIIGPVRRESSTVVGLVGQVGEELLTELTRSPNISLIRPSAEPDRLEPAVAALREASHRMSPFVLVAADPLTEVAAAWQAMWDLSGGGGGAAGYEQAAGAALSAWRADRFQLPDYYLVLSPPGGDQPPASGPGGFYLGPLRAARPHRVVAVVTADGPEEAARVRHELRSLRHGRWWPPLGEVLGAARGFYPGGLAEGRDTLAAPAD